MEIQPHWKTIRRTVNQALRSNRFCAVATVNPDGSPRISPIGSLIFGETGKAVYFDEFPHHMRQNLDRDQRICVMAVVGGFWYWLIALRRGRFASPPGLRLMGRAGVRRKATPKEVQLWQKRVKPFRRLKGYQLLWKNMRHVREIHFDSLEPLYLGSMGKGLWEDRNKSLG